MSADATVMIRDERLELLAERAAHWPRAATLFVADPHFGKAAAFRASGLPVPHGTTSDALGRLDATIERTRARRIIFLGDFLHAREGRARATLARLAEWRARHGDVEMVLVRGNHDRRAGDPPPELGVACVDAPAMEPPFVLAHHPTASDDGYVLAGHLHPGARLAGPAGLRERLACFWIRKHVAVLPAFGDFTGLADVAPEAGDRVFVVADGEVMEVRSA